MIPTWLHPILRKILMGMVNDEWTKAGRPILAENVRVVEGMVFDSGVGRSSVGINEEIPMRTRAQVLFIEEEPGSLVEPGSHDTVAIGEKCILCDESAEDHERTGTPIIKEGT